MNNRSCVSYWYDLMLLCFPIWFSVLFYAVFHVMEARAAVIYLAAVFLIGESHFGMTWLFFADSSNWKWLAQRPFLFLVVPILLVGGLIALMMTISLSAALLLSSVASAFHVTRQSIGISKLFSPNEDYARKVANGSIYVVSAYFLLAGFFRFYYPIALPSHQIMFLIGFVPALLLTLYLWKLSAGKATAKFPLSVLTGMILYSPYTFVDRVEYAVVMGVGVHWLQYLALTIPIYIRKSASSKISSDNPLKIISRNMWTITFFAVLYGLIMTVARQWNVGYNTFDYSKLIMVPVVFQFLHYYFEGFIWRFSDKHIRQEVGQYVFAPEQA